MARVTLNYDLRSLNGRMGDVVFYQRFGRQFMRPYVKPGNPNTPAQRARRGAFREAVKAWQALHEESRKEWSRRARRRGRSGYNVFISSYLNSPSVPVFMPVIPQRIAATRHRAILVRRGRMGTPSVCLQAGCVTAPFRAGSRAYLPYTGRKSRL